jgi:lipopolysaccharide export system permease protein
VKLKILDRYMIGELLVPFLAGTATFTLLFMSMDTLFRVANMLVKGQSLWQAADYLLSTLPSVLVLTFPMAVLLACLMAFGGLSSNSELVALKAGGIGFFRVALPGMVLALLISIGSYVLNEKVVPEATYRAHNIFIEDVSNQNPALRENISLRDVLSNGTERRIFARKLDPQSGIMYDVTIQSFENGMRTEEVYAQRVVWQNDHWLMYNVNSYQYNAQQSVENWSRSASALLSVTQSPMDIARRERMPEEMSRGELRERIADIDSSRDGLHDKTYNQYVLIYNEKLAIPFTCFVFAMLGMPLGVRPQRTSAGMGLGISLVFILFYYLLMTLSHALGENSVLPASFAAWLPNTVFGGLGVGLVAKASRT